MRLIDADAFKDKLNSGGGESVEINISKSMELAEIVDTVIQAYRKCLFAELEKMPTAFDALGKETCDRCDGCKNDDVECMHGMRAYSDCYEN